MIDAALWLVALAAASAPAVPAASTGEVTARDGLKLHYVRLGTGPQGILVPLGFWMQADFGRLSRASRSVVFYDQRNRGRSGVAPPERSTLQDEIADMETVRERLGLDKVTTVGYSYLGLMTVMYAMQYPDRVERLVQLGPVPRKFGTPYPKDQTNADHEQATPAAGLEALERVRRDGMPGKEPRAYCERDWEVTRYWLIGDPAKVAALGPGHCDLPNEWPVNLEKQWQGRMPEMEKLDLPLDQLRRVTQPVLTIHGTKDRNAPYGAGREWASTLPNARLVTVPGAAHQSWADDPALVFGSIEEFLEGRWPSRAERLMP